MSRKSRWVVYSFAIFWLIMVFFPFVWAFRISLIPTYTTYVSFFPRSLSELSLVNYKYLLYQTKFPRWLLNSLIVSGTATFLNTIACFMLGYVLARKRLPGSDWIFTMVLALMMVPYQITIISLYLGLSKVGLTNNLLGLILPMSAHPFGVFLMRQYILMIPKDYEEAALIDGSTRFQALFRIVLPQTLPAIGVLLVSMLIETWNNFILPLVIITKTSLKTVTVGVADLAFEILNTNWGVLMAGSLLGALPTIIIFVIFNKYFLKGLTLQGGIK
ncbi:MAG: carbohydrate ABC transporter permease [Thermotogae bacterium]|nr:carbohydrate ABC transporter permease [Thermotogota bacterium]RKX55140.1 MAG: hypothetical protein DRP30_00385 [Thermotoga sp.]HDM70542.1 carbohydrate ABC transporter permease [Thermotogales bacterium]